MTAHTSDKELQQLLDRLTAGTAALDEKTTKDLVCSGDWASVLIASTLRHEETKIVNWRGAVEGNIDVYHELTGDIRVSGAGSITGDIRVSGAGSITGDIQVSDSGSSVGTILVARGGAITGTILVARGGSVTGDIQVSDSGSSVGDIRMSGVGSSVGDIRVSDSGSITGNIGVARGGAITGNIWVSGGGSSVGTILVARGGAITGTILVARGGAITGNIWVSDSGSSVGDIRVTDNGSITGIRVTDNGAITGIRVTENGAITGNILVSGRGSSVGTIDVTDAARVGGFKISGTVEKAFNVSFERAPVSDEKENNSPEQTETRTLNLNDGHIKGRAYITAKDLIEIVGLRRARLDTTMTLGENVSLAECDLRDFDDFDKLRIVGSNVFTSEGEHRQKVGEVGIAPLQLAGIYRRLRVMREEDGDRPGASDFYYQEMRNRQEAARHQGGTRGRAEWAVLGLYHMLSEYGTRAWRPAVGFIGLLLLGSLALLLGGIDLDNGQDMTPTHVGVSGHTFLGHRVVLLTAQSMVSFFRPPNSAYLSDGEQWIQFGLRFLGPLLLAQILFAIRERVAR